MIDIVTIVLAYIVQVVVVVVVVVSLEPMGAFHILGLLAE